MTMKKKEMAELFDELGEYALETEAAPIGEQSDRDSKKLVEIALLASGFDLRLLLGHRGGIGLHAARRQARAIPRARAHLAARVRHRCEGLEMMERRGNDGRAAGRPAERRECRREQGGCGKAAWPARAWKGNAWE